MKKIYLLLVFLQIACGAFAQMFFTHGSAAPVSAVAIPGGMTFSMTPTLTPACMTQSGSLWCTSTLDFTQPFSFRYEAMFDLVPGMFDGADGICVVFGEYITPQATTTVGSGGNLGYLTTTTGVPLPLPPDFMHSFAVEMDIFANGIAGGANYCDIAADHLSIDVNGDPCPGAGFPTAVQADPATMSLTDGVWREYKVIWDPGTSTLLVYCNCSLRLVSHFDYRTIFTHPYNVHWGFTASTGSECAIQCVRKIGSYSPTHVEQTVNVCPGPCPFTLTAPGLGGAAAIYSWSSPLGFSSTLQTVSPLCAADVIHSITYSNTACGVVVGTYTVTSGASPITGINTLCLPTRSVTTLSDNSPGGTWTSGNMSVATIDPLTGVATGVSAGVSTITYNQSGGCNAMTLLTVTDRSTTCSACDVFGGADYTILGASGVINSPVGPGNYYIGNDVTITSNVTFSGAVVLLAPGVRVSVAAGVLFELQGCHLFCCGHMWTGIEVQGDGQVILEGDRANHPTLIEDALIGVDAGVGLLTPPGGGYSVGCSNAIFNRNNTGIRIDGYTPATPLVYPFRIYNTVFTQRDFSGYTSGGLSYPFVWPENTGTDGLKTASGTVAYNLLNYTPQTCHNYVTGQVTVGVGVETVGRQVGPATAPGYSGVGIGTASLATIAFPENVELNLFDLQGFGVKAINSNVAVHNCSFINAMVSSNIFTNAHDRGGEGIYAVANDGLGHVVAAEATTYTYTVSGVANTTTSFNSFYNCTYGMYVLNYADIRGRGSYMTTTQSNAVNTNSGLYGYDIQVNQHYRSANLSTNTIVNVANGISAKVVPSIVPLPQVALGNRPGQLTIDSNSIVAVASGATGTNYVDQAISVNSAVLYYTGPGYVATTEVNVDHNTITDAYNGIYVNGIKVQPATSDNNTIGCVAYPSGTATQYGIWHSACIRDAIRSNTVTGPGYTNGHLWAIRSSGSDYQLVTCNHTTNMGIGFEFDQPLLGSGNNWLHNIMTNHGLGFVLNGGQMGQQGSATLEAGNEWLTSGGVFTWTGSNYQTFTMGAPNPTLTSMYVGGGVMDPTNNRGTLILPSTWYGMGTGTGNGLIAASFFQLFNPICGGPRITPFPSIGLLRQIAGNRVAYPLHNGALQWTAQNRLLQNIAADPLLLLDEKLQRFAERALTSPYSLFALTEAELAQGHPLAAGLLLTAYPAERGKPEAGPEGGVQIADSKEGTAIADNYWKFYKICIRYQTNLLTSDDSTDIETLAGLCPVTGGDVVYKARAMYDVIFDTLRIFDGYCDTTGDAEALASASATDSSMLPPSISSINLEGQKYVLYPNPNDGNFTLGQAEIDNDLVRVEIWDAVGRNMYKGQVQFAGGISKLHTMDMPTGIYLLQVADSKGRKFKFKFTKE